MSQVGAGYKRAMSRHGNEAVLRQNQQIARDLEAGVAYHRAGQRDRAEQLYRKVLRRAPNQVDALRLLGVIASERSRHEYAVQLISRALAVLPGFAEAHRDLGEVLRALGRLDEAADHCRAALALKPDYALAHCSLASILIDQGLFEGALEHASRAAELMPEAAQPHFQRGSALAAQWRFVEAAAAYRRALALQPNNAEALSVLGAILTQLQRIDEAMECHRKALDLQPNNPLLHLQLSRTQVIGGDPEGGEASCRRALSLDPNSAEAWRELGQALRGLGRFDEARSCLRRSLELDPKRPDVYGSLALLGERAGGEEQLQPLHALLGDPTRPAADRINAGFALGMLLDNADRYDEAFPCFHQANSLYHHRQTEAGVGHDRAVFERQIEGLIASCTPDFFASVERGGPPSEMPVFVVGMPRSGTTLVEQIAVSHSRVAGAGELQDIAHIIGRVQAHVHGRLEDEKDQDLAHRLADEYLARLQRIGQGAERVINKMPDNILGLGVIALLFPAARVIFCRRDLRDTCLSCYFQLFDVPIPWAYDLADCGLRALQIERLAEHWRRVVPLPMLTVDYEALVIDPEGESRRLIEFLGLDWEPACLDFHKTERPVVSASAWQVRQPLYNRSVGRWRHYEHHLGPLLEVLAQGG